MDIVNPKPQKEPKKFKQIAATIHRGKCLTTTRKLIQAMTLQEQTSSTRNNYTLFPTKDYRTKNNQDKFNSVHFKIKSNTDEIIGEAHKNEA